MSGDYYLDMTNAGWGADAPDFSATALSSRATSATDWGTVLSGGLSRMIDVAGQIAINKSVPYYQTTAGTAQVVGTQISSTLMLLIMGLGVVMVLRHK